ncbi:hypothetical protein [Vibrio phage vB_VmeM-Yong XC32]|nr:hypothetical protein [Vibrio phage vB_VmeM-Yong XC31]QAX96393.1 hypothetical protein [Vibrio phage vB_VmeM-Yong XC32]QAX97029.1 hypothetical protein [Vibrio phage vB_VmeM-Yong MS32]
MSIECAFFEARRNHWTAGPAVTIRTSEKTRNFAVPWEPG